MLGVSLNGYLPKSPDPHDPMTTEFERIEQLAKLFDRPGPNVTLGIGDDAAILLPPADEQLVWTVDACVQDVHFRADIATWEDVGYRSFMAAASDLAAMSAHPIGALCSITLPKHSDADVLLQIAAGQRDAARCLRTFVIGGNLASAPVVTLSTTLLGHTKRAPQRSGARAGDVVAVCGDIGWAAAGLGLLLEHVEVDPADVSCANAIAAWKRPTARIDAGRRAINATSLIDISDGLAQDAMHIAVASGVRIDLETQSLVTPGLVHVAQLLDTDPIRLILHGGEDYALVGTFAPHQVAPGFIPIGQCHAGRGLRVNGEPCAVLGYDHFR